MAKLVVYAGVLIASIERLVTAYDASWPFCSPASVSVAVVVFPSVQVTLNGTQPWLYEKLCGLA